jgi:hypothetical protein
MSDIARDQLFKQTTTKQETMTHQAKAKKGSALFAVLITLMTVWAVGASLFAYIKYAACEKLQASCESIRAQAEIDAEKIRKNSAFEIEQTKKETESIVQKAKLQAETMQKEAKLQAETMQKEAKLQAEALQREVKQATEQALEQAKRGEMRETEMLNKAFGNLCKYQSGVNISGCDRYLERFEISGGQIISTMKGAGGGQAKPNFSILFLNKYGFVTASFSKRWLLDTIGAGETRVERESITFAYGDPIYYTITYR